MIPRLILAGICLALFACGTYRGVGGGGYRSGNSGWRTSSDYSIPSAQAYIPQGEFRLQWPVQPVRLNRGFRPGSDPDHDGVDLGGKRGQPILAAHEGRVIYAGREFRGYGNMVMIEYGSNWATLYAHLDTIVAREGLIVRAGDPIGTMGKTGRASGVHLHFELLKSRRPIDPLTLLYP